MNGQRENSMIALNGRKFQTREELLDITQRFCLSKGYAISIKRSNTNRNVTIGCDRGGKYRDKRNISSENRQRTSVTRLINCPFEIVGRKLEGGLWILMVKNDCHNHEPSSSKFGHPSSRHLTNEEMKDIERMSNRGIQPRQIITSLRKKNPSLQVVSRTIYNVKAKIIKEKLGGRSMIRALLEELGGGGFSCNYLVDGSGHLTHVFFAHPKSIMLTSTYSGTFVMECTYKTNKYKMSLLNIVGISSCNTIFCSCFAFLKEEREEDYIWALNMFADIIGLKCQPLVIVSDRELALMKAIQVVFPTTAHLLCIRHIEKHIIAKCKKYFESKKDWESFLSSWNEMVCAKTEEAFEGALTLLHQGNQDVLTYIKNTWLPYKDKFVSAWTEKYKHFGIMFSSEVEDAHSKLKMDLQVSTRGLRDVKDKICLAIENEFHEIRTKLANDKSQVCHSHNIHYFKNLVTHVSTFALTKLFEQYEMAKFGTLQSICTCSSIATMGLPCAHMMSDWKDGVLPLGTIHSQWRIDTKSFDDSSGVTYSETCGTKVLLNELQGKYNHWPIAQKDEVKEEIVELVATPQSLIHKPIVRPHKYRLFCSKNRRKSNLTRRESSESEIVEISPRSKICQGVGHTSGSYSNSHDESGEIDLNSLPSPTYSSL